MGPRKCSRLLWLKKTIAAVAATLLCCLLIPSGQGLASSGKMSPSGPDQVILTWTDEPRTTQTISWREQGEEAGIVQYLPAAEYQGNFSRAEEQAGKRTPFYQDYYRVRVTLRGLKPDTSYIYRVGTKGIFSEPALFTTASESDSFSFLYLGDVQAGYESWGRMLNRIAAENPGLKFALIGGDLVDQGSSPHEWQQFLSAAEPVFNRLPLMPAVGNHDDTLLFQTLLPTPKNGPLLGQGTIYSFDYGNCHFTVLNSNQMGIPGTYGSDTVAAWLRQDLAASSKGWKIVVMHHPPYQKVADWRGEHLQTNWVPLFEQGGVDLVLTGHQHIYLRTKPLRAGKIKPDGEGIVYVIGNSGAKHYAPGPSYDYVAKQVAQVSNYQLLDIDGNTLTLTTKDADGEIIDSFRLTKQLQEQVIPPGQSGGNYLVLEFLHRLAAAVGLLFGPGY